MVGTKRKEVLWGSRDDKLKRVRKMEWNGDWQATCIFLVMPRLNLHHLLLRKKGIFPHRQYCFLKWKTGLYESI